MIGALIGILAIWVFFGAFMLLLWLGSEYPGILVCIAITAVGGFLGWSVYTGWYAG